MRILLDTHVLLWFLAGDDRLADSPRQLIEDGRNQILLSAASLWEIAIKMSLGRLVLERPFEELIPAELEKNAIDVLPIQIPHLTRLIGLPMHHRDPFDRLIIAQAQSENIAVVTADNAFNAYEVSVVAADRA